MFLIFATLLSTLLLNLVTLASLERTQENGSQNTFQVEDQRSREQRAFTKIENLQPIMNRSLHLTEQRILSNVSRAINSCNIANVTGRYNIRITGMPKPVPVVCEAESFDGGWLVIQQRLDGSVNFNRSWSEYRDGFGVVGSSTEFWIGLEAIHQLTEKYHCQLAVELRDKSGRYGYVRYSKFRVDGEADKYKLSSLKQYAGTIADRLTVSSRENFSTYDSDNDDQNENCAAKYAGGWWFYRCRDTLLNGPYVRDNSTGRGIFWKGWTSDATYSRMMIRCNFFTGESRFEHTNSHSEED